MTRRLYYEDSLLRTFDATVAAVRERDGAPEAAFDVTAFYPGGGGQPADRGRLGTRAVLDVMEEAGVVWHRLDAAAAVGERAAATLDWARRFDHMQQHTGQHILSRAFVEVAKGDTKSFHLGDAVVTIDVEHAGPSPDLLAKVEERANEIVWEDREVKTGWTTLEEALRLPLRKPPDVEGKIRIVEVDGFDWSACGGTHVGRSGQVGLIHLLGTERYKGGVRVAFVCGGRALRRLRESGALLRGLALEFTAGEADLPRAVARLKEERAALERRMKPLLRDALDREAAELVAGAPTGPCGPVVAAHFADRDPAELGVLAAGVVSRSGIALLFATEPGGAAARAHFAAPQGTIPVGALLGSLTRRHGGKGGGRPESAQGSFPADRVPLAVEEARNAALTGPGSELFFMNRLLLATLALTLALLAGVAPDAKAQFGQNKVHYKNFQWRILRTEHFDIHYYEGTEEAVQMAALMAERSYRRLSSVLHHQMKVRVPLVLYASHTDFEQTNITPELISIGTGGVTEFLKRRVFLPFTGSFAELDHVLTHELVHAFQVDILFGDSAGLLGNPFSSSPPLWFMEGMAEYLSVGGVDANTQMWLRDASLEGYLIPIKTLQFVGDIRVYRFGQSILQFIADTYGIGKIGEILKRTRRMGNVERALESTTGLSIETLSKKWQEAVRREYLPQIADFDKPDAIASKLTDSEHDFSNFNVAVSLAPSGNQMVYISDRSMYNDVYLASALDGKVFRKLVSGERTGTFETLRFFNTSIAWSPDEKQIAIPAKAGGEDALYLVDIKSGKVRKKLRFGLDAIYSPAWSPDGQTIAFVGIASGLSSLRVTSPDGKRTETLLSGLHAVRDPAWSPDGSRLAFLTDEGEGTDLKRLLFSPLRVAIYDVATKSVTVPPGQVGQNTSPQWSPDGRSILFVSDRTGIANLYRVDLDTGKSIRLTNLLSGISGLVPESPAVSVSRDGKRIVFTSFTRGGWDIYSVRDPKRMFETPSMVADAPLRPAPDRRVASAEFTTGAEEPSVPTSAEKPTSTAERYSNFGAAPDRARSEAADRVILGPGSAADTAAVDSTLAHYIQIAYSEPLADSTTFLRLPYKARFARDYISGSALFASNVGFAGSSAISFSDVLGNHNLLAALNLYGDLRESDIYLAYTNLSRRTNWGGALFQYRVGRLLLSTAESDDVQDQIYRGGAAFFSRPFSRFRRFEFGSEAAAIDERVLRYNYALGRISQLSDEGTSFYVAPYVALVADNALYGSTGPINGGRSRYSLEHAVGDITYSTGLLDWRRYTNIRHRYSLAQRVIAGASVGRDPQLFRFGGPFTFRGVDYGDLRGTRLLVTNLEFRFPLIEQLGLGWPLPLYIGGINGVFFVEGATAWEEGHDPKFFSSVGGLHTENFRLAFGAGARVNLGYFILRYDFGREHRLEGGLGKPQHFLSFGADF